MIIYTNTKFKPKRKAKTTISKVGTYKAEFKPLKVIQPIIKLRDDHPSLQSQISSVEKKDSLLYTGDKLIGISIIHKSCLQPVFSKTEAIEAATMRR